MARMTTIAIDCRPLQNRYANRGIGTVTRNLLSHLVTARCSTSLVLCGTSAQPPLRCGSYRMIKRPANHDWFWEQVRWPMDLRSMKAGIFHSTVSLGLLRDIGFPLFSGIKSIATVYDLTPLRMPELAPHAAMKSYRIQKRAVKRADRIITISKFVKNDLMTYLEIPEEKVSVLPMAVDDMIARVFNSRVASSGRPTESFILAMGEDESKNIAGAIGVFATLSDRGYSGRLRIIGTFENQCDTVKVLLNKSPVRDRIIFTGCISPEQIVENYATCALFLYPSFFEGFGLPVLEAMYCGAPVVASNAASLPEAGGDAALYADPRDTEALAVQAERLLNNHAFRREVIDKGIAHAGRHSWSEAAEMVIGIYEELGATFVQQKTDRH